MKNKEKTKSVLITKKHLCETHEIYSCPQCSDIVIRLWMFFCPTCGIKIKWSKNAREKDEIPRHIN